MKADNKLSSNNWEEFDTRHLVFKHSRLSKQQMEEGYNNAYNEFYKLKNIVAASGAHERVRTRIKHLTYSVAWKKFEPVWNFVVKHELFGQARRILESTLK